MVITDFIDDNKRQQLKKKTTTKMTSIRGISQLVSEAEKVLGPNTVFVITPDNGGSVWSEIVIPENLPTFLEPFPKLSGSEG